MTGPAPDETGGADVCSSHLLRRQRDLLLTHGAGALASDDVQAAGKKYRAVNKLSLNGETPTEPSGSVFFFSGATVLAKETRLS